jgi:hypothetical protein
MTVKIPDTPYRQLTHIWFKQSTTGDTGVSDLPINGAVHSAPLIGSGPQILPVHDRSVNRIQPGRPRSLDHALIATQVKFSNF